MKLFTLTGLLLTVGAAAALAATPDPSSPTTSVTDSYKTVRFTHETQVNVNNYLTKVLGVAVWDGPAATNAFTHT